MLDVKQIIDSSKLMRKTKQQLLDLADQENILVGLFMTKKEITELILECRDIKQSQYPVITLEEEIR